MSPYRVQYPTAISDLLPVLRTMEPNLLDSAIKKFPRTLACRFSSVTFSGRPRKASANAVWYEWKTSDIGSVKNSIPRFSAKSRASARLPSDEYGPGMETPSTFSRPKAETAMAATTEESMPPLKPTTAERKPDLQT